jgi:hypothetical protein
MSNSDWSQRPHLCVCMSIASTCENMCRRLEQQHERKIMNYQWERKRDQRVVTDDTRVLMRQTDIPGDRLRLILALVCCARAQLLVLTLNYVLLLLGHYFFVFASSSSSPFFCVDVYVYACTCLLYVKMNLVISTSKMTNCHDGLRSIWYWRREKKSCSCLSSSFFHKQLPIHVTFHLYTSTNHFRRCRPYDKVVFWFITLSIAFLMCVWMSFCRTQISLVDPVAQWDKCH